MINENHVLQQAMSQQPISDYVDPDTRNYRQNLDFAGIYIFWFNNHDRRLVGLNRSLVVDGPDRIEQNLIWDWNLDHEKVCLYVGKSTNLQKRLGLHLLLKTANLYREKSVRLHKKTTSCQLRSGFDYLYQRAMGVDILEELRSRLLYSFLPEENFVKRFYIEDLLIGRLLPWFNVDSER